MIQAYRHDNNYLIKKFIKANKSNFLLKYSNLLSYFYSSSLLLIFHINPLMTDPLYLVYMAKISILKMERSSKNFLISVAPMSL